MNVLSESTNSSSQYPAKKSVAVVVPVFNEDDGITIFFDRLHSVIEHCNDFEWSVIFVDDGSTDATLRTLRDICGRHDFVGVLAFSRNFGKELALTAALNDLGDYDCVICMDGDLQHPPELIPEFLRYWELGYEVVSTRRSSDQNKPTWRKIGSQMFHFLLSRMSSVNLESQATDFGLYDGTVVREFNRMTEKKRLFRGLIEWLGFRTKIIEFSAPERAFGRDSFSFNSLLSLAVTTLMSFSMWPLKIIGVVGFIFSFGSALAGVIMLGLLVVNGFSFIRPLAFVIVANVFLTGLVLCSLGLVGWYIGVIHSEVIGRPLYVIRTRLGISKSDTMSRPEHETIG